MKHILLITFFAISLLNVCCNSGKEKVVSVPVDSVGYWNDGNNIHFRNSDESYDGIDYIPNEKKYVIWMNGKRMAEIDSNCNAYVRDSQTDSFSLFKPKEIKLQP